MCIKLASSPLGTCASSYKFNSNSEESTNNRLLGFNQTTTQTTLTPTASGVPLSTTSSTSTQVSYTLDSAGNLTSDGLRSMEYDASNRLSKVQIGNSAQTSTESSKITYLHNAQGLRVFKSEPQVAQTAPDEASLGTDFTNWLKNNFGWMFAQAQQNATLGQSYVYDDGALGSTPNLLGEYGNGGSQSTGRLEYLWLPTEGGQAIPIGLYKDNRFYAIHTDHLGTPRQITDDTNKVVWQWAYSAFGENKPTGVLQATSNPNAALANQPAVLLKATTPSITVNLRFPGQYADEESNLFENGFRSYRPGMGRYDQFDPLGLAAGWSGFIYVEGSPLMFTDPTGLDPWYRETWTPARVWTDMSGGTTTYYDPMTKEILIIPTKNGVVSNSLPGAAGPYNGEFTYCEYPKSPEYGTAKWRTTDPRARWIHGGGSVFGPKGALKSEQGWAPTKGCTRAQNQDVEQLCAKSTTWKQNNPGVSIPYSRW